MHIYIYIYICIIAMFLKKHYICTIALFQSAFCIHGGMEYTNDNTQGPFHLLVEGITTIYIINISSHSTNSGLIAFPDLVFIFPGKTDHRFV
jgi:hypothetical protein